MYQIQPGSTVTLARYAGQGAFGVLGGTACQVVEVGKPAKPGDPVVLLLRPISAGQLGAICVRVPAEETMEGIINILEAQNQGFSTDILSLLQGLEELGDPVVTKRVLDFAMLKLSDGGRELALKRPDKPQPGVPDPPQGPLDTARLA